VTGPDPDEIDAGHDQAKDHLMRARATEEGAFEEWAEQVAESLEPEEDA
jgi:hypothetical protein